MTNLKFSSSMTFLDFILSAHHQLSSSNFFVIVIVFWRIWFRRNRIIHDKIILCSKDVVDWAYSFLEEFTAANIVTNSSLLDVANSSFHDSFSSDGISLLHGTTPNSWIPPPAGFFKINIDTSVSHSQDSASLGAVCKNDMGLVMWSCSMRSLCSDVLCAEAKALILSLSLTSDLGFYSFILESDVLSLVQLIHSDLSPFSEIGLLLQDIRDGLALCRNVSICFASRNSIRVADFLAKLGCLISCCNVWMNDVPSHIVPLVSDDYHPFV
ncbi:hypothetical protein ACOSQ3_018592 [Xanthoceras sorbifolium]